MSGIREERGTIERALSSDEVVRAIRRDGAINGSESMDERPLTEDRGIFMNPINQNWAINIEPLDAGYLLKIGCKRIAVESHADLLTIISNYLTYFEEPAQVNLEKVFNTFTTNEHKYEFMINKVFSGTQK